MEGFLKPDYPQGISSRIREEMLLQSLSLKLQANNIMNESSVYASFSHFFDTSKIKQILRETMDNVRIGSDLQFLKTDRLKTPKYAKSAVEIYQLLDKSGYLDNKNNNG